MSRAKSSAFLFTPTQKLLVWGFIYGLNQNQYFDIPKNVKM